MFEYVKAKLAPKASKTTCDACGSDLDPGGDCWKDGCPVGIGAPGWRPAAWGKAPATTDEALDLAERSAIMLADTGGSDEGEVETWAEAAVRAYWAVLRGGLDPERARVERLGEEPWRVGGEG